jgi:hypothetical protein
MQSILINNSTNDVINKNNFENSPIEIKSSQGIIKNSEKNQSLIVSKLNCIYFLIKIIKITYYLSNY